MRNSKLTFIGTIVICGLSLVTFSSCRIFGPKDKQPQKTKGLIETPSIKLYQASDVPVPANFSHQPEKSYAYITGSVRTASIQYIGSARTDELLEFYRKQMPQFGWMETMTLGLDSKKAIAFQKKYEKCEIIIEQKPSDTYLVIKIGFNVNK